MTAPAPSGPRIVDTSMRHWKIMAAVGLVVTVVAMATTVFAALAGNGKAEALAAKAGADQARETEQLKQSVRDRERDVEGLKKELSKGDDLATMEKYVRQIEELKRERDQLTDTLAALARRREEHLARIREPGAFGGASSQAPPPVRPSVPAAPGPPVAPPAALRSAAEVAKSSVPAVAIVRTDRRSGTGFFVDASGELLTNYHVIAQSGTIEVTYLVNDQRRTSPAKAMAVDIADDLALLKVEGLSGMPVLPAKEGPLPPVGASVLIIGFPSLGKEALEYVLADGVVSNVLATGAGTTVVQTTAAINEGADGGPLLDLSGALLGIATAKAEGVQGIGFAVSTKTIAGFLGRRAAFEVKGTLKEWEVAQRISLPIFHDPSTGIALKGSPTRLFASEDGDRLAALDPSSNGILSISLSQRKVTAMVFTGSDPSWMAPAPGGTMVWVAHQRSGELVKVDLAKGAVVDRVTCPDFKSMRGVGATSGYLWALPSDYGSFMIYSFSNKTWVKSPVTKFVTCFTVDGRRNRLVLLGGDGTLYEVEPERLATVSAQAAKAAATLNPQAIESEVAKLYKGQKTRVAGRGYSRDMTPLFVDERNGRLYFDDRVFKSDNLEEPLSMFPAAKMSEAKERVWGAVLNGGASGHVWAASPDGRWAATGTHLVDVARRSPPVELPMPGTALCFSKDSKTLWWFDFVNKVLMPFAVGE